MRRPLFWLIVTTGYQERPGNLSEDVFFRLSAGADGLVVFVFALGFVFLVRFAIRDLRSFESKVSATRLTHSYQATNAPVSGPRNLSSDLLRAGIMRTMVSLRKQTPPSWILSMALDCGQRTEGVIPVPQCNRVVCTAIQFEFSRAVETEMVCRGCSGPRAVRATKIC